MNAPILLFCLIELTISISHDFTNPLQRFVYDDSTNTIILASVNHIYSLNSNDLSIVADIDLSPTKADQSCSITNRTLASKSHYYLSSISHLTPSTNHTFNQLLLLTNNSILICSTSNRGGSCQRRSLINLNLITNSSQRVVSSSPFYPSVGLISKNNNILYVSTTYDHQCDPFYEIPTISGRHLTDNEFLSTVNLNAGQSALQQSTYTLRLLNIRLIKEFFLHYLYAFEYKHFTYFLTIQQSDIHQTRKHKLQTKILRFCQTLKQSIIKSYVELPMSCGNNYHYLVTGKFSSHQNVFYGLFRNTTLANATSTSHAICSYTIETIQEAFLHTIKRCLVDGKGYRGLDFISPDAHCVPSKNLNELNDEFCPDENDRFFQYPIGGHRLIEQAQPIIELNDKVNFTALEIISLESDAIVLVGDDHGTVHTFLKSDSNEIHKQTFQSKTILDLQLINRKPTLSNAKIVILTENQIIQQNLSVCEQYTTCGQCSNAALCHWCSKENRCTATYECRNDNKKINRINMCVHIERIVPQLISLDTLNTTELQVIFNIPIGNDENEYMCLFNFHDKEKLYYTNATLRHHTLKCSPPVLNNINQSVYNAVLSIVNTNKNISFGSDELAFINCSNFLSCSSCILNSNLCVWNRELVRCLFHRHGQIASSDNQSFIVESKQCPSIYLQQSANHLAFRMNKTFNIHIEHCNQSAQITSCYLYDPRKRFSLTSSSPSLTRPVNELNLCLLQCSFQWLPSNNFNHFTIYRPLHLHLSIEFSNATVFKIPDADISLYQCEHMAFNCTSCSQIDPVYECTWCNNMCMLKNQSIRCSNNHECTSPVIYSIEPLTLPMNGGSLVTIKGKHFDLFGLVIHIADVPCQLIERESSNNKIVCQSGDSGSTIRSGPVRFRFGSHGPRISSNKKISYIHPTIDSIIPLVGIQSGGTVLTIQGGNLTIGNSHVSIFIGAHSCQLLSVSATKIECETKAFPNEMLTEEQPIKVHFDRQTTLVYKQLFTVVSNPVVYSFDHDEQYKSFRSGGHEIIVFGENFTVVQNIQLEFRHFLFVSPSFRNRTHLVFVTPSIQQLHSSNQQKIEIKLHLDNFNKTSSVIYMNDPIIYPLEPMLQEHNKELTIYGINFTAVGHTKEQIHVNIGCDQCSIVHFEIDRIICQPPRDRPNKYSKTNRLCYDSEHPTVIVSIDNLHVHVGFVIYPKKLIFLGVLGGCLFTILLTVLTILIIVCTKIRNAKRKYSQRYLYRSHIIPYEVQDEKFHSTMNTLPILLPIRTYLNYLQFVYHYNQLSCNKTKVTLKQDLIDQFKFFIEHNNEFIDCVFQLSIQSNDRNVLNNVILTQRYNLKNLFKFSHPLINLNICILTAYDTFLLSPVHSLFSQLYSQLQSKIYSGPIDAIEQTVSYYSLNIDAILHEHPLRFRIIQVVVHIDTNEKSSSQLTLNVTCLTCDTISQVKQKILRQYNSLSRFSIDECKLYLLPHHSCSSSASSTASSSVPLTRKPMLTKVLSNRTIQYSTTIVNDSYPDSRVLLLDDIDSTNEQINSARRLNTLQHYGIVADGYELKFVLSNNRLSAGSRNDYPTSCHYCSIPISDEKIVFNYLTSTSPLDVNVCPLHDRTHYLHLLNHTYEEIDGELNHLLIHNHESETYRLFETKSTINALLINLIESLFTNHIHNETFFSELIEQYPQIFHYYYAHFIPFIFQNIHCLLDVSIDRCLRRSLDILAMIFEIACCQQQEHECSSCTDLLETKNSNSTIPNCTLIFADEIKRVRLYYSNLERCLNNKALASEYSSTNTGIDKSFELDDSIYHHLFEYSYLHADEIIEHLKTKSSNSHTLSIFLNLVKIHRSVQ